MKRKSAATISSRKLSWAQINDFFEGEWVELVDYKWDWNLPFPSIGCVRHHATDRNELISKIKKAGSVEGSVVLYLGNARSTFELTLSAAV